MLSGVAFVWWGKLSVFSIAVFVFFLRGCIASLLVGIALLGHPDVCLFAAALLTSVGGIGGLHVRDDGSSGGVTVRFGFWSCIQSR